MSFFDEWKKYPWKEMEASVMSRTPEDVEAALGARTMSFDGLMSLLSPAAEPYLEEIAQKAHRITQQRFGRVISLFVPLYLSNECSNSCAYCGFNSHNPVERLTLTPDQAEAEGRYLHGLGFRHLLLVSGEMPKIVSPAYLNDVVERMRPLFSSISIEIYPMEASEYEALYKSGVDGLVVFQETYNAERYAQFHLGGKKRDFRWRLETPERGGQAGMRRIGIGALLGLSNWRIDALFLGLHGRYLLRSFWKSHVSISFPRLQPAAGEFSPPVPVSDTHMVQMITALRIFLPDAGFVLSTREPASLRDNLVPLGVTSMSAGSRTDPGGYTHGEEAEAQFSIADERSAEAVAEMIRSKGYEPVWKDWDAAFLQ